MGRQEHLRKTALSKQLFFIYFVFLDVIGHGTPGRKLQIRKQSLILSILALLLPIFPRSLRLLRRRVQILFDVAFQILLSVFDYFQFHLRLLLDRLHLLLLLFKFIYILLRFQLLYLEFCRLINFCVLFF